VNTVSANIPHAIYDPTEAGAWLLHRHSWAAHLVDRLDAWLTPDDDDVIRYPDLESLAMGINAADQLGVEWKAYEYRNPAPVAADEHGERAYDEWQRRGPKTDNGIARAYGPMSSGEKRLLRLVAVLGPTPRVQFSLDDASGIGLQCCSDAQRAGEPHPTFVADWARLISEAVSR
jgi:hypothetical protein